MPIFRVNIRFNQQNLGTAINTFTCIQEFGEILNDATLLNDMTSWMEDIYDPLLSLMDTGFQFASGQVLEMGEDGSIVRIVGSISPDISGTANSDQLALPTAASAFVRTNEPKIRGSKRFSGFCEPNQADGLFDNALLNAMALAVIAWASNRGSVLTALYEPGVLSTSLETFVRFAGTAVITNIPGTQVTRKPGRGS